MGTGQGNKDRAVAAALVITASHCALLQLFKEKATFVA